MSTAVIDAHERSGNRLAVGGVETFVLDVATETAELPTIAGVTLTRIDGHTIEVEMSRTHDLNSVFAALSARGIVVTSMRNKANRLEELFVRLVDQDRDKAGKGDVTVAKAGIA